MNETTTQLAMSSINTLSSTQFGAIIVILFLFLGAFIYFIIKQQKQQNDNFIQVLKDTKEEHKEVLNNITEVLLEVKNEVHITNKINQQNLDTIKYERDRNTICHEELQKSIDNLTQNEITQNSSLERMQKDMQFFKDNQSASLLKQDTIIALLENYIKG